MRLANPSFITNTQGWPSKLGLTSYGAADTSFPEIDFQGREGLTSYGSPGPVFYASESYTLVDNLAVAAKPYSTFTGVVGQALRPFPQYQGYNNISPLFGKSRYDSLQVTGRKRSGHGLDFIASYTMSKTTADTDGQGPFVGGLFSSNEAQDFYDRRSAKSLAAFDITHYVKLRWIYELPFGSGKRWSASSGWLNRLVSGWKVSAIQQYYSGAQIALLT